MPFTSASALGFPSKSCAEIAPDHRESSRRIFGARFEDNAQTRINIAACLHSWYFHGALENGGNRFPLPAPRSRAWFILGGQVQGRTSPCLFKCPLPARLHSASSSEHNRFARPKSCTPSATWQALPGRWRSCPPDCASWSLTLRSTAHRARL